MKSVISKTFRNNPKILNLRISLRYDSPPWLTPLLKIMTNKPLTDPSPPTCEPFILHHRHPTSTPLNGKFIYLHLVVNPAPLTGPSQLPFILYPLTFSQFITWSALEVRLA